MKHSTKALISLCVASSALAVPVTATQKQKFQLEEVIVTAQKRSESLQEAPISIASFSQDQLTEKGIYRLEDLQSQVPNLQFSPHPNSATTPRIFIRGIGLIDDQVTLDPSVAVYMDGVYLARSQGLSVEIADIERIEILRGPQGTLYGRNATGGSINFVNRQPVTDAFEFSQQFTVGQRDKFYSKTVANAPVHERAALKLSYLKSTQDGFVDNIGTGVDRFGDTDRKAFMLNALWRVTDTVELRYTYNQSDIEDTPAYVAQAPTGFNVGKRPSKSSVSVANLEVNDVDSSGHMATLIWQINDAMEFKSITAYRELEAHTYQDYLTGAFAPLPVFTTDYNPDQEQFTQEFQLQGSHRQLTYIAGLYYFEEEGASDDFIDQPLSGVSVARRTEIDNSAYAAYGQVSWTPDAFEQRLTVTGGLRYSVDERKAKLAQNVGPINTPVDAGPFFGNGDNDFDNLSPSLILAYDFSDTVNAYAKYVEGYKTGGFSIRSSSIARFNEGFDEETVTSYEVGIKSELWQRRLRINAAAFSMDYDDIQVSVQSDPNNSSVSDVVNAGEATIEGLELDLTALLFSRLTLGFSYGYTDADYDKVLSPTGVDETDDFRFIHIPRHSINTDLSYDFPSTPYGYVTASVNYSWQDRKYSDTTKQIIPVRNGIDDYGLLNARLALRQIPVPAGELELAVWGKNLENETYYVSHFFTGVPAAVFGEPRTVGADLIYRF
ncbi:MAG: TonB-dependent receptor [Halioglobus sp.]|nr:TonB-dependent receptor [Halioglobus sp.]